MNVATTHDGAGAATVRNSGLFYLTADNLYFLVLEKSWYFCAAILMGIEVGAIMLSAALAYLPGVALEDAVSPGLPLVEFRFAAANVALMGFGTVFPVNHVAYALGVLQCFLGITLNVFFFSVVVTKFQRPKGKLLFAERACFTSRDGAPVLLLRVGNLRCNLLHLLDLRVTLLRPHLTVEGEERVTMTPVAFSVPATMSATATFAHAVDEHSPLRGLTRARAAALGVRLQCLVSAHDPIYDGGLTATHVYGPADLAFRARHADVMRRDRRTSEPRVDFGAFNAVVPTPAVLPALEESSPAPADAVADDAHVAVGVGCGRASLGDAAIDGGAPRTPLEAVCVHTAKVLLACAEAGVEVEVFYADLNDKPGWLSEVSAKLEAPSCRLPGRREWNDSSAASLQELGLLYPQIGALLSRERSPPVGADDSARLWAVASVATKAVGIAGPAGVLTAPEATAEAARTALGAWEGVLGARGGAAFLCGDAPGLLDCQLGPVLDLSLCLFDAAALYDTTGVDVAAEAPLASAYLARLRARPSYARCCGGGESNGRAAMVRTQVEKAARVAANAAAAKRELWREMTSFSRAQWPPAVVGSPYDAFGGARRGASVPDTPGPQSPDARVHGRSMVHMCL